MESPTQPSFIPQDAVSSVRGTRVGGLPELVLLVAILLLIVSGGLAGAVFLYQQYLQASTKSKVDQLSRAQSAFQPALIVQLERLDDRMRSADTLLHTHLAPSALFQALEQATNQNISFNSFSFDAVDPTHMSIKMNGVAASVNSIALQADLFAKSGVFTSPIFSGIDREAAGVRFDFSALVNPTAINYAQVAAGARATALPQQQTQQPSEPASPFTAPQGSGQTTGSGSSTPSRN